MITAIMTKKIFFLLAQNYCTNNRSLPIRYREEIDIIFEYISIEIHLIETLKHRCPICSLTAQRQLHFLSLG